MATTTTTTTATSSSSSQEHDPYPTTPRPDPSEDRKPRNAQRRARQVSSRYMTSTPVQKSPAATEQHTFSSSNLPQLPLPPPIPVKKLLLPRHRSHPPHSQTLTRRSPAPSVDRRCSANATDSDGEAGSYFGDENRPESGLQLQSLETIGTTDLKGKARGTTQRKRAVARLFRENGEDQRITRPGSPVVTQQFSTPKSTVATGNQRRGSDRESRIRGSKVSPEVSSNWDDSVSDGCCIEPSNSAEISEVDGGMWCDSPVGVPSGKSRMGSSMLEIDQFPTRCLTDARPARLDRLATRCSTDLRVGRLDPIDDSSHRGTPLCYRSLNSALSNCQVHTTSNQGKNRGKTTMRPIASPRASMNVIQDIESRKIRRVLNCHEDAHTLRMLENRYLQWRFINAKARVAAETRRISAENSLYSLSRKLLEMWSSVANKKIQLAQLHQLKKLSSTLEIEMSYLDDWTDLEADHSDSLSGTIKAVRNASLRLPLIGNVKVDFIELSKVLDSAKDVTEGLFNHIDRFVQKIDGVDIVISNLGSIVSRERALIEDCGNLLSEVQSLQTTECSLRGCLMQLKRANLSRTRNEAATLRSPTSKP